MSEVNLQLSHAIQRRIIERLNDDDPENDYQIELVADVDAATMGHAIKNAYGISDLQITDDNMTTYMRSLIGDEIDEHEADVRDGSGFITRLQQNDYAGFELVINDEGKLEKRGGAGAVMSNIIEKSATYTGCQDSGELGSQMLHSAPVVAGTAAAGYGAQKAGGWALARWGSRLVSGRLRPVAQLGQKVWNWVPNGIKKRAGAIAGTVVGWFFSSPVEQVNDAINTANQVRHDLNDTRADAGSEPQALATSNE